VHEYASGLTSTPKAELFCSCKRRKFVGQNKVNIFELYSQNVKFLGQKLVALLLIVFFMCFPSYWTNQKFLNIL